MAKNIREQHEVFIGEMSAFLETLMFKPISLRPAASEYGKTKGVLLKYLSVLHKDEFHETPHVSYHLFLHEYKELAEIKEEKDFTTLEKTLNVPYEPYNDVIGLDKGEKKREKKILMDFGYPDQEGKGLSCIKCTLDFVCNIKTKINDLFTNLPIRLYPHRKKVWENILKEIGTNCPHFNLIVSLE